MLQMFFWCMQRARKTWARIEPYLDNKWLSCNVAPKAIELNPAKKCGHGLSGKALQHQVVTFGPHGSRERCSKGIHTLDGVRIKKQAGCVHGGLDKGASLKR
eukprot:1145653-Pelagomonas_calceolata.AAC.1